MKNFEVVKKELESRKDRSAWNRGVNGYAFNILRTLEERTEQENRMPENEEEALKWALNGAYDWSEYSYSGLAYCYNSQIAKRLCNPTELKKSRGGVLEPNAQESWLDVQARALYQAWRRVSALL